MAVRLGEGHREGVNQARCGRQPGRRLRKALSCHQFGDTECPMPMAASAPGGCDLPQFATRRFSLGRARPEQLPHLPLRARVDFTCACNGTRFHGNGVVAIQPEVPSHGGPRTRPGGQRGRSGRLPFGQAVVHPPSPRALTSQSPVPIPFPQLQTPVSKSRVHGGRRETVRVARVLAGNRVKWRPRLRGCESRANGGPRARVTALHRNSLPHLALEREKADD